MSHCTPCRVEGEQNEYREMISMSTTSTRLLYEIMRSDPDGGEVEPTQADYDRFEHWVINTYGRDVWDAYRRGGWGESNEDAFSGADYGEWYEPDGPDYIVAR